MTTSLELLQHKISLFLDNLEFPSIGEKALFLASESCPSNSHCTKNSMFTHLGQSKHPISPGGGKLIRNMLTRLFRGPQSCQDHAGMWLAKCRVFEWVLLMSWLCLLFHWADDALPFQFQGSYLDSHAMINLGSLRAERRAHKVDKVLVTPKCQSCSRKV